MHINLSFLLTTTISIIGIVVVIGDAADDPLGGGFGGEPKFCPPYRCGKGLEPVPKWPLSLKSTGCSMGGGMSMFQPNQAKEADPLETCCDLRHACLQTCGAVNTHCEDEFSKCSDKTCDSINDADVKQKCKSSASITKMMIGMQQGGCQNFDAYQHNACDCVATGDKANEKRERILRNFYKKFNPDSIDKVPALAKKIDGNKRKMVGLLLALYKKFPKSINKIKDPQQERMEQMMKDVQNEKKEEVVEEEEEDDSGTEDLGTDEL